MSTAAGLTPEAIVRLEPDALVLLDQTLLPGEMWSAGTPAGRT